MRKNSLGAGIHLVSKALPGALASCVAAAFLLSGCGTYRSFNALAASEPIPVTGMNKAVVSESEKLATNYDALRAELERAAAFEIATKPVPPRYDPLENKIVSINMYDTDIGKLLWTLADQLGMNLVVDPLVLQQKNKTSLYLRNVTVREVYNHVLEAFDLHGEIRNGALVISMLEERIFNAGFLNANLSINLSSGGDVFGSNKSSSTSGSSGNTNDTLRADFSVRGNTQKQIDPYDELERAVRQVLGKADGRVDSPQQSSIPKIASALDADGKVVQRELPPEVPVAYSLNRLTGALYVKARPSQMRSIDRLVERNKNVLRRQVLVEAQLIDVQLNDGYQFGVDWTLLRRNVAGLYGNNPLLIGGTTSPFPGPGQSLLDRVINIPAQVVGQPAGTNGLGVSYGDNRFSATLKALSSFGELRILSNPSVRVRNGTPALLSVGTNIRYISKSGSTTYVSGSYPMTAVDIETDSLFSGVVVGVIPYIHENGRIELLVHPMQTEVEPDSLRPVSVGDIGLVTLPVINYKGLTTTLDLTDGDMVMIGGLIDQSKTTEKNGLPGLNDIPILGNVFGDENKTHASRELVLVLRVRII